MNVTPTNQSELEARDAELRALRNRVAQLEAELAEQAAAANEQIAAAQRRLYWIDELELDLNAMLSRRWLAFLATVPLKAIRRLRREIRGVLRHLHR
jgi:hypothetical protein